MIASRKERGSATVWVLLAATLVWSVATWGLGIASVAAVRAGASTAADLAALAAAAKAAVGDTSACGSAAEVARANRATVRSCTVDPVARTVEVLVERRGRGLLAHAPPALVRARAGPSDLTR